MKIGITGAGGLMGQHITELFIQKGCEVLATYYNPTTNINELNPKAKIIECDMLDYWRKVL